MLFPLAPGIGCADGGLEEDLFVSARQLDCCRKNQFNEKSASTQHLHIGEGPDLFKIFPGPTNPAGPIDY